MTHQKPLNMSLKFTFFCIKLTIFFKQLSVILEKHLLPKVGEVKCKSSSTFTASLPNYSPSVSCIPFIFDLFVTSHTKLQSNFNNKEVFSLKL